MQKARLLTLILVGATAIAGCSSFKSPSAEYVKPGELCTDVSDLPDPNAPPKSQSDALTTLANQYGIGGRREESPERLLMQADSYFEQKRYHDSARLYKKYLALADVSTASPELLGVIHYRIGYVAGKKTFYSEAKGEFAQALQFAPLNNEYLFAYAKASYDAGDYQEADRQFTTLLARVPNYPEANRYYGLTLLEGSNRANAIQPLTIAVGALEAHRLLADKYYEVGELELAAQTESLAIQLAAQSAQPVPKFPHKEQLLVSAQNATYAQTLNAMSAVQASPNTPPLIVQYAPPVATPGINPVAQPAVQPVVQPAVQPVVQPILNPTPTFASTGVQDNYGASSPQTEPPTQIEVPSSSASNATDNPSILAPPNDQSNSVAPQENPDATRPDQEKTARYASVAPAPVVVADALQGQFPASVGTLDQNAEPVAESFEETPYFDDVEEWDESAFATSGSGYLPATDAASESKRDESTSPEQSPVDPDAPDKSLNEGRPQYQSIQPTFAKETSVEEAFAFAESRVAVLENVERLADEAEAFAIVSRPVARPKLVGYLAPQTLETPERSLPQNGPREIPLEQNPVATIATQLPPIQTESEDSIRFSDAFEDASSQEGSKVRKRTIKTNVDVGRGNPGLFVSTAATKRAEIVRAFRPGSIANSDDVDQSRPDEFALLLAQQEKRRDATNAVARNREEEWARLVGRVDALSAEYAFVDQNALAYYEPIYLEYADACEGVEEGEEWDDSAFATSGSQPQIQSEPVPEIGGFGDYAPPSDDLSYSSEAIYVAQLPESPTPQIPIEQFMDQQVPVQQVPVQQLPVQQVPVQQVPIQQVPVQQVPIQQVPVQQVPVQQVPIQQVPVQQVPVQQVPVQQVPIPIAQSTRSQTTPEQRLEAARRAGAEVVEISPEQYRRAAMAGLGRQPR